MLPFVHLHVHTEASADGLGTVDRLVAGAKDQGFEMLAMTDHGTLASAVSFVIACEREGVKPILGMEAYIAIEGKVGHITLLADGDVGFSNLIKLNNLGHKSNYRKPAITLDQLFDHKEKIVVLSGCQASPFQRQDFADALGLGARFKSEFGTNFYIEAMYNPESPEHAQRAHLLASSLDVPLVATNDAHFPYCEDGDVHGDLVQMKSGYSYDSKDLWLMDSDEIYSRGIQCGLSTLDVLHAVTESQQLADSLSVPTLKSNPSLPHIPNAKNELHEKVRQGVWNRYGGVKTFTSTGPAHPKATSKRVTERWTHELQVINKIGYPSYFLILLDLIDFCKREGIRVGPGRGSGAGSLVLYLLGITDVDPLEHGLQFERFLNVDRRGLPDVDIDIESNRRQEVLDYANEKYGAVPIATYSTYSHKSLTRDLCRHFKIGSREEVDEASEMGASSPMFKSLAIQEPRFMVCYDTFMGQIRHTGKHAGGIIITDREVPIERLGGSQGSLGASWTEGGQAQLTYAGVVKFDMLGLSVLSALSELEYKMVDKADIRDLKPLKLFRSGDLAGIFQFSGSPGIHDLTVKLQPNKLSDLVQINALFRPGPLDAGVTTKFHEYKTNPKKVPPHIGDTLDETYGVIVYQEQMMEVYRKTVGGTLVDADNARRLLVKAKPSDPDWVDKIDKMRYKFITGAQARGMTKPDALEFFHEIETFARYAFNKSHSVAYSMLALECAWWKYYYPAEFYAAMLNNDAAQTQNYIFESAMHDIDLFPPLFTKSEPTKYVGEDGKIFLPFISIKYLGETGANELVRVRELFNGQAKKITEIMPEIKKKAVNARARRGLYMVGAFDELEGGLKELQVKPDELDDKLSKTKKQSKFLGFVIPTPQMVREFKKLEASGAKVGIIDKISERESNRGKYRVFYLTPSGVFWSRKMDRFDEGDLVAVKVDGIGQAVRVKQLFF